MKIAIATKNRPYDQHTLKNLYKAFSKEELFLFVEPQDLPNYEKYRKVATIVDIKRNDQGLRYARRFVYDYFPKDIVFTLDDDIIDFRVRGVMNKNGYFKLKKMGASEISAMFRIIEGFMSDQNVYGQATISFSGSNWLFPRTQKVNTRVHVFKCNNHKVLHEAGVEIETGNYLFEDYDFTLEILSRGLKNLSFYTWAFTSVPMGTNKGGCQEYRKKRIRASIDYMKNKWGADIVKEFFSKEHNLPEIKVNWKKAFVEKI